MKTAWVRTTLGEIAEIVSGATPKTSVGEYWGGGIPWVTPKELSGLEGPSIASTERTLTEAGLKSCAASLLPPQSVLLSSRAPIGLVAINDVPMATNQGFKSLVPDDDRVDSKFLYWWLRRHRALLEAKGNGATFKEVSKKVVDGVAIDLPPVEEQLRIAAVLDAVEALRAKRGKSLAKLEGLIKAVFVDTFSDHAADASWAYTTLGEIAEVVSGATPKTSVERYWDGEARWATPKDLSDLKGPYINATSRTLSAEGLKSCSATLLPAESVLLSSRAPIGYVAVTKIPMATNQGIKSLVPDSARVDPRFLYAWLQRHRPRLESLGSGATFKEVSKKVVEGVDIILPPLKMQRQFGDVLDAVETMRANLCDALVELDTLFASLQQRAFRGEL